MKKSLSLVQPLAHRDPGWPEEEGTADARGRKPQQASPALFPSRFVQSANLKTRKERERERGSIGRSKAAAKEHVTILGGGDRNKSV